MSRNPQSEAEGVSRDMKLSPPTTPVVSGDNECHLSTGIAGGGAHALTLGGSAQHVDRLGNAGYGFLMSANSQRECSWLSLATKVW